MQICTGTIGRVVIDLVNGCTYAFAFRIAEAERDHMQIVCEYRIR